MNFSEAINKIEVQVMDLPITDKWGEPFQSAEEIIQQVYKFHGKRWGDLGSNLESGAITVDEYCKECLILVDEFARRVQGRRILKKLIEIDGASE